MIKSWIPKRMSSATTSRLVMMANSSHRVANPTSLSFLQIHSGQFRSRNHSCSLKRCFSGSQLPTNNDDDNVTNPKVISNKKPALTVWQQAQSIPNVITLTRMASTPLLAYFIVSEQYTIAIGGCALAAASDFLDGYLAKQYGWTTVLGTYLDPLADKVFVNTLGVSLWYSGILPTPLISLWATKDFLLLSGTGWFLYKKHQSINFVTNSVSSEPLAVTPSFLGKLNTTLQFVTLGAGILSPVVAMPPLVLSGLCWTTGCTTVGTLLSYADHAGFDSKQ
eukprot:Nitzschia sp. Nitz4//scaffold10_size219509//73055//73973//NITZ4_001417-RA/size219509-augustus-gene-0.224-mRNA-1//1//CDS//3329532887//1399//frame0